ncbi:MAG: prephenate dehydrogenase/arogenate dehydrogenase family protein [Actinomycetota bacterium]|nr:prephenate dehydrogenase/arogenate dehydrogenase family protein [Actinomycetota bacterium]
MTTSPTEASGAPESANGFDAGEAGPRRALVVGTGLIGASLGLALRRAGWHVSGTDVAPGVAADAVALGALDRAGDDVDATLAVVATPVRAIAGTVTDLLADPARRPDLVVTDVGGTKGALVAAVDHPRFVGGHPMAGSEQVGVAGARADLFVGASWVLTPTDVTDPVAYARVRAVVAGFGAQVIALPPAQHDALVAVISHVPHLTAATLMDLAAGVAERHAALLPLAAGGFRDMTRVAAGHPGIWPDICEDNAPAIVETLDSLIDALSAMRRRVAEGDRTSLLAVLERASVARRALSERVPRPEELAEVRVPVPDRPGVLAEVTTLAAELGVNIVDLDLAHSVEGLLGVLVLVVGSKAAPTLVDALLERGHRATAVPVGAGR